jgi:hypothetical protein
VAAKVKPASRLALGKQIKAQFGDGTGHSFETIVTKTGARAKKVYDLAAHANCKITELNQC